MLEGQLYSLSSRVQFGKLNSHFFRDFHRSIPNAIAEGAWSSLSRRQRYTKEAPFATPSTPTANNAPAGWTEEDIKSYAGPTLGVVTKLAEDVRGKLDSTYTICESGTAGPSGGVTRNRIP